MRSKPIFPASFGEVEWTEVQLCGDLVHIPKVQPMFVPYIGEHDVHTWGNKPLLLVDGKPQFAEVAITRVFEEAGWQARWVETYGHPALAPAMWRSWDPQGPRAQTHAPIADEWLNEKLLAIASVNGGSFSGCSDVVAWTTDRLVFAEAKRHKKDRVRASQLRWMEAALRCDVRAEDLLVVEWTSA